MHYNPRQNIVTLILYLRLSKDLFRYRLKFHENLLLNILQNGYHKTYSELFNLIDYEEKRRINAGISSPYWTIQPLTERHQLLCEMMTHLMNAENFNHSNQIEEVYKENLYLAGLFQSNINDQWLLDIYLQKCLKIVNKGKYPQSLELYKQLQKKLEKHKNILQPSINPFEKQQTNIPLYIVCYEQICRIILTIYQPNKEYQMDELLLNLNEALKYAEKSENQKLIGLCNKQISQVYQVHEEYEMAHKLAEQYFDIAERSNDILEKIEARKLLGSINENLSKLDEAEQNYITIIEYTKLLHNNNTEKLSEAYELLAKFYIFNTNKYDLAKLASENGLNYAQINETIIYNQLKLWYSISKSKLMEPHYLNMIIAAQYNSTDMIDLIKWKDTHYNLPTFDKDHFREVTCKSVILFVWISVFGETLIYGQADQKRFRDFKVTAPTSVLHANVRSIHREFCTKCGN
uniref:Tetratricopeptide repeat protein 29 n=1 Tax=Schistosoma haematobium TaxID=6185 RepID=A0A095A5X3_SCHHA